MISPPAATPEPVLLVIADISGYTRYMTANAKTLAHSQTVITELIHALLHEIELPFEIAKLEGDAIFLFCRKNSSERVWSENRRVVAEKLLAFFQKFSVRLSELSGSTTCTCNACTHIEKLQLKIIVHSGEVLFHRVLNFTELAGVDVIILHRLLKNSVKAEQYLLLTEAARQDLEFPEMRAFTASAESYDGIGRIQTFIHLPHGEKSPAHEPIANSQSKRFSLSWQLFCKLWFAPFARRSAPFRHVTTEAGASAKFSYALLIILLTPFFLPVGAASALIHSLKPHRHLADGSCCSPK